jgi:glycosyltransferase involved in cell wall biosynthesis
MRESESVAMRYWTINGRFLTQPLTGVQRYARQIVSALDQLLVQGHPLARNLKVEILRPPGTANDLALEKIELRVAGRGSGYVWEQVDLPRHARGGIMSLCNVGPLAAKRQVLCIHDLNTFLAPESYSWKFRALYRHLLPALGNMASKIVTVSHFSAGQIARFGVAPASKIAVIPNGREHALGWVPRHSAATRAVAGDDTIVLLGSPAPHKNVAMMLGLAEELAAAGLRLAVVGSLDARVFSSSLAGTKASNVLWLGRLTDGEIAALLQDCLCLAFPSFTEGFGLPPLEAMTVGCPVVASDRASLPEICADAALYAPPDQPRQWLAHFLDLRSNTGLRSVLRRRGRAAAQRYSWPGSAELYLQVLAEIDGVPQTSAELSLGRAREIAAVS